MEGGVEIGGGVLKKLAATLTNGFLLLFNKGRATQMCFLNLIRIFMNYDPFHFFFCPN